MSIKLSDSIRVGQQKPLEDKYFNELVPYTSTSQVNTLLPKAVRHIGLTVNINGEEYWYKDGIEDKNLVFKSSQKTIEVNIFELRYDLIYQKKLEPGRLYKITLVEDWCFSGQLIKAIYLKAVTNNTLEIEGVGEFYTPKYNTSDSNLGIWKGELLANGMISSASYNIGDKVIWGNLFWENISGNIGTNEKEIEGLGSLKIDNYLSESDWRLITPNDDESLYNIQFDSIKYDLENYYINYRADDLGNVYEITYNKLLTINHNYNLAIIKDPTFIYYLNAISLFQWGRDNVYNNIINESFVSNCNYNHTAFYDNTVDNSIMIENNFLNVGVIGNDFKNASIVSNYLKTYGGILYNNLENSSISSNKYYFEISYNKLRNGSAISVNNDNNIIVSNNFSKINGNNLDNNGYIISNIFVEEGKGVSGYIKGINGNEIINNSSINNNTIKNGSRIMDHNLSYFSTINGNTLDTDSNIYNNQVVQGGKIDNNILTGHGRIYGNQLDRRSEITNCKLRISPATSYATTMKNNRLFTGKIQNVDFGDIVNPVGTNPNDPNFGGNGLSECIIENNSIIKDLTFPNHGGVGIQVVKMNGFSEFKNITVNNSIRNVDFINTIFNETSDYSKLIEGNGYQTNGFTKTYIDGVLLQDRFDEKQDVLTEDNVGSFMDLELSTKSTPTSGDTVLAMDSVTGKAVKIPTDQLGGGGSIDISGKLDKGGYAGTAQDLKNEIDNVQIGGRNLFLESEAERNSIFPMDYNKLSETLIEGKEYTISFEIKGVNDGRFLLNPSLQFTIPVNPNANEWFKISKTFVYVKNDYLGRPIYPHIYNATVARKIKLEKGNKATDWTPAPKDKQDRLQDISGNVGVGKTDVTATEKLDVNGNVKANGFKTPNGAANKVLTSDGNTFDLSTKADLVSGKVPANQLPAYVDDVLEFANLASFPETGENGKIYIAIDTNLTYRWGGSSYVVMSSSLALGETSSTAYRGDRGNIAYDHSQLTGNTHNTKVEELSDVSGTDTTIIDTDEILKKEIAGIWKKLSWSNIKANLKAYFDNLYAPKAFNIKVTTPSSYVTGTTSETEVLRIEIPANSLSASDVLRIPFLMVNKVGTAGTIFIRGKLSTSTTMPSSTTDQLFQTAIVAAANQSVGLDRSFIINDEKIKGFPNTIPTYTSSAISSNLISQKPFDRTVTNYLYISINLGNTADQARLEGMQLTNS